MPSKNTKKRLKESAKSQQPSAVQEPVVMTDVAQTTAQDNAQNVATQQPVSEAQPQTAENTQKEKTQKTKKREKRPSKIKQKGKEVFSELKKVNWPTVGQVAKKTGVVLAVVAVFAVVLLGINKLLQLVYQLLISNLI